MLREETNFPTCWASWVTERVGWPIVRATHLHIPQDHPCARDTTSNLVSWDMGGRGIYGTGVQSKNKVMDEQ